MTRTEMIEACDKALATLAAQRASKASPRDRLADHNGDDVRAIRSDLRSMSEVDYAEVASPEAIDANMGVINALARLADSRSR